MGRELRRTTFLGGITVARLDQLSGTMDENAKQRTKKFSSLRLSANSLKGQQHDNYLIDGTIRLIHWTS
jgi:uncharacterized protein YaaQ